MLTYRACISFCLLAFGFGVCVGGLLYQHHL